MVFFLDAQDLRLFVLTDNPAGTRAENDSDQAKDKQGEDAAREDNGDGVPDDQPTEDGHSEGKQAQPGSRVASDHKRNIRVANVVQSAGETKAKEGVRHPFRGSKSVADNLARILAGKVSYIMVSGVCRRL